jgi:hypothetical protein
MVLAKLTGGIAQRLEQLSDGGIFRLQPDVETRDADLS